MKIFDFIFSLLGWIVKLALFAVYAAFGLMILMVILQHISRAVVSWLF